MLMVPDTVDFIDSEAEESDEEEELEPHERKKLKQEKAAVEDSSEEEEDGKEKLRKEFNDLIDNNRIENKGEDFDGSGGESRKKSDDEEYDVLVENLIVNSNNLLFDVIHLLFVLHVHRK
ncbi:hypothetical protein FQA39_LY01025 [Lamprigera yunnana]|nr:hypothetical protein FQA39_LY01025 [Lamprigera yunnana]